MSESVKRSSGVSEPEPAAALSEKKTAAGASQPDGREDAVSRDRADRLLRLALLVRGETTLAD